MHKVQQCFTDHTVGDLSIMQLTQLLLQELRLQVYLVLTGPYVLLVAYVSLVAQEHYLSNTPGDILPTLLI